MGRVVMRTMLCFMDDTLGASFRMAPSLATPAALIPTGHIPSSTDEIDFDRLRSVMNPVPDCMIRRGLCRTLTVLVSACEKRVCMAASELIIQVPHVFHSLNERFIYFDRENPLTYTIW